MTVNRIYFDDWVVNTANKKEPFYDIATVEGDEFQDGSYQWIHKGYGRYELYQLWYVDTEDNIRNFVAEDTGHYLWNDDPGFDAILRNPKLALQMNAI